MYASTRIGVPKTIEELFFMRPYIFATKLMYFKKASPRQEKKNHTWQLFLSPFQFTRTTIFPVLSNLTWLFLVELDVVGREQTGFAAEVAEPPVVVGEFL
jgi:hypothetical protein